MAKQRLSTTVDAELISRARSLSPGATDASVIERALNALLATHRRTEIDGAYAEAYDAHPANESDEWGDLASFADAAGAR